jgi:uncharacterized membrane protein YeaQ/YmgE (transglycosylase-associated protein family)
MDGVQTAVASWLLIGVVVGLVAHRLSVGGVPGGALGALVGGGAGGFLGGAIFAVLAGAGRGLDPINLAAAAAGAAALVAMLGLAGRGSLRGR